jgi:hypothetical protein
VPEEATTQNALSPDDYDIVQNVFKSVARSEWFDRTEAKEKNCARLVLLQYGTED